MKSKKICFTSSSGGHFNQLYNLIGEYNEYDRIIITEETNHSRVALEYEKKYFFKIMNRKESMFLLNMILNSIKIFIILIKEKPKVIISTGALITVPVCYIGKLLGSKIIFIESFAKVKTPTLSGKLIHKISDRTIIQWKDLSNYYGEDKKVVYGGTIY